MANIHRSKNQKHLNHESDEEKTKYPKCGSKNMLTDITGPSLSKGEKGDVTLCCLDCDYREGIGVD